MKALILAAGFGTRLLPYTEYLPKPLFTLAGRPLLDLHIRNLENAGCTGILVNTHHLHTKIEDFIARQNYAIPVLTRYEPEILGTGGAMKNAGDFFDDRPFMVINSDIHTDIEFRKVYEFHLNHPHPATLVLYDDPEFNTVCVDKDGFITGFSPSFCTLHFALCTFTGVQVLDPEILNLIPTGVYSSSIEAFRKLVGQGKKIRAFVAQGCWKDMGTPERYRETAIEQTAIKAFELAGAIPNAIKASRNPPFLKGGRGDFRGGKIPLNPPLKKGENIEKIRLKGDGSDRGWYRLKSGGRSLILADHGIRQSDAVCEVDSFVSIGRHLRDKGIPVPEILFADLFSGLVVLEDLGDTHLQDCVKNARISEEVLTLYKAVIDRMIAMSTEGILGFEPSWTYQTAEYDRDMILDRECRYFVEAFLRGYLGMDVCYEDFEDEFSQLADAISEFGIPGFMHRDFQSRNIMLKDREIYFIDFQGGRKGPIQYDLASLLIDPYTNLPNDLRNRLTDYCIERLSSVMRIDEKRFRKGYSYCGISRNLQMLGAFGFLSRVKGKVFFEQFVPIALEGLRERLSGFEDRLFPRLRDVVIRG